MKRQFVKSNDLLRTSIRTILLISSVICGSNAVAELHTVASTNGITTYISFGTEKEIETDIMGTLKITELPKSLTDIPNRIMTS